MPIHRILHVPTLLKLIWDSWPKLGTNQFMSQGEDRLRLELQNRLPGASDGPNSHIHPTADTVHIILEGEGEYAISPDVWVPIKPGDIILTRGGEVHGGRGTNPDKPLRYLVIEGPAPEGLLRVDGEGTPAMPGADNVSNGQIHIAYNGRIGGTNMLLGGPTDRPDWVDMLPPDAYRDR
jgi:mannose-6-phosphate isomerase-like protein (cupin superfamily)